MSGAGAIHVFIGSPVIASPSVAAHCEPDGGGSGWRTAVWGDVRFPSAIQDASQIPAGQVMNGETQHGEWVCDGHRGACAQEEDLGYVMATPNEGMVSALVSHTGLCPTMPAVQRLPAMESQACRRPPAMELLAIQRPPAMESSAFRRPLAVEPPAVPRPPAVEPPAVPRPPAVEPPAVPRPPAVEPPAVPRPPAVEPPAVPRPPAVESPALCRPPAVEPPPLQRPPAVEPPPLQRPPAVEPPAVPRPPAVEPPAVPRPPAVEPPPLQRPPAVESPALCRPPVVEPPPLQRPPAVEPPPLQRPPAVEPPAVPKPPAVEPPPLQRPPAVESPALCRPPVVELPPLQRPPAVELHRQNDHTVEVHDPDDVGSDACNMGSAGTEFLTVLASSQLAVKSLEKSETDDLIPPVPGMSEFIIQDVVAENLRAGSISQQDGIGSSELFTDPSDDEVEEQSSKSIHIRKGLSDIKSDSAVGVRNNADYLESASSKRKQVLSSSSASFKQCKKSKPSVSPVQCTMKPPQQMPAKTLTPLKYCLDKSKQYNVMVVVLQPCHIKEIKAKSGPNIGSTLPLATIVVMDQSGVKHKVLLWRTAAFWSLALLPGEIIVLTHLSICEDRWSEDLSLQSSFKSKLVNLGSCSTLLSGERSDRVENCALKELLDYIRESHYYLYELSPRQPQLLDRVQFITLTELRPESLVHSLLKVNSVTVLKESTYHFKGMKQNKIILTVEQVKGQTNTLVLWGSCVSWCDQIRLKSDHVWVFRYLLCKRNIVSGDLELHTTPWSSCECLFDDDQRAVDFRRRYNICLVKQMSLLTLFEDRYSGEIQAKGSISQIGFHIPGKSKILIDHETSISDILKSLPDIIYTGCGKCKTELTIDDNGVYEQCYVCLPFNQVRTFYRAAQMNIVGDNCSVRVQVPPDIVENIFLNIDPKLLPKGFPSCADVTYGAIVADLCQSLVAQTGESFVFTIRSQFVLDENSIPLEKDFHLLDFHLDFEM
ncbi:shieldin complex subunit 2 [Anomaloglossus baeobatrachus]|uniref:shieldin complex subunit 2 n=1 Tax=Anomaloglossus baeobatrachus TaxID=238106 RepID=UPI003F4F56E7